MDSIQAVWLPAQPMTISLEDARRIDGIVSAPTVSAVVPRKRRREMPVPIDLSLKALILYILRLHERQKSNYEMPVALSIKISNFLFLRINFE